MRVNLWNIKKFYVVFKIYARNYCKSLGTPQLPLSNGICRHDFNYNLLMRSVKFEVGKIRSASPRPIRNFDSKMVSKNSIQ